MTLYTTSPGDEREAAGWVNEWSDKHEVPLDNRARAELIAALSRQAPAAPAEAGRSDQWGRLYTTANTLVASIGYMGEIDSRADEVASLMDALHDLDGGQWMPGLTPAASPAAPTQALLGWTRYEKARKLNPAQWAELHQRNLAGETFDDMIDALPATTQRPAVKEAK